jgi:hypothetical protein
MIVLKKIIKQYAIFLNDKKYLHKEGFFLRFKFVKKLGLYVEENWVRGGKGIVGNFVYGLSLLFFQFLIFKTTEYVEPIDFEFN